MAKREVVETVYGRTAKYEIVKLTTAPVGSVEFWIYKNGRLHRGSFSSLRRAVELAEQEG